MAALLAGLRPSGFINRLAVQVVATSLCVFQAHAASAQQDVPAERVISLGGAITEIVYALGEGDRLIGRDTTSSFPAAALD